MRTILEYLVNKHTSKQENIFDKAGWSWPIHGISTEELNKCKDTLFDYICANVRTSDINKSFLKEYKAFYIDMLKKYYVEYLLCDGSTLSLADAERSRDDVIKVMDEMGFAHAEKTIIPQGWFHAIAYIIKKKMI